MRSRELYTTPASYTYAAAIAFRSNNPQHVITIEATYTTGIAARQLKGGGSS